MESIGHQRTQQLSHHSRYYPFQRRHRFCRRWFSSSSTSSSSTSTSTAIKTPRRFSRLFMLTVGTAVVANAFMIYGLSNGVPVSSYMLIYPFRRFMDPEKAHDWAVFMLAQPLNYRAAFRLIDKTAMDERLEVKLWGLTFDNPVGMAAGFDKHAQAIDGLLDAGFGFVEVGTITPKSQEGNPKPRVFRLDEDKAVINRFGFNSQGQDMALARLDRRLCETERAVGILGINLGKNKTSPSALEDYSSGIRKLGPFADYIVINVSSPNTPGLRDLQKKEILHSLLTKLILVRNEVHEKNKPSKSCDDCLIPITPLLVKIAPDLNELERKQIAEVCLQVGIDGMIISNTTVERPEDLKSKFKTETGGLSGRPLMQSSTELVRDMYRLTNGKIPIIGVGGIFSGDDAYRKVKAGASLIQIYSSLVFCGPKVVLRIKQRLMKLVQADGYRNISEAVGTDHDFRKKPQEAQIKT